MQIKPTDTLDTFNVHFHCMSTALQEKCKRALTDQKNLAFGAAVQRWVLRSVSSLVLYGTQSSQAKFTNQHSPGFGLLCC